MYVHFEKEQVFFFLSLATKYNLEVFSKFKEIKQRNEVLKMQKRPQKQGKLLQKSLENHRMCPLVTEVSYTVWNMYQFLVK